MKLSKEIQELQKKKYDSIQKDTKNVEELETIEKKLAENLLSEQRKNLETELNLLKDLKIKKGRSASIFALKDKVVGKKKIEQEATVVKDPSDNNKEVTKPDEIRSISLKYCTELLTNRAPNKDYIEDIQWKKDIHEIRMLERFDDDVKFSVTLFEKSLKALEQKSPNYLYSNPENP